MRKIPTLFKRDPENMARVTAEVHPDCQWVLDGEGIPTRKYDGTCVMRDNQGWWARREVKPGKTPPAQFRVEQHDEMTGKTVGWEPVTQSPFVKFFREAIDGKHGKPYGTYELCGPKVQGNPENLDKHVLIPHAEAETLGPEFQMLHTFEEWRSAVTVLGSIGWEGIVWHHPDGRMAKLKARDFGPTSASGTSPCTRVEERGSA